MFSASKNCVDLGLNKSLFVLAMVILLCSYDFNSRILKIVPASITKSSVHAVSIVDRKLITESLYDRYIEKLEYFDRDKAVILANEEVLDGQIIDIADVGWRAGSFNYRLVAIFLGDEKFAVLERFEKGTGARNLVDVRLGEKLSDHSVVKLGLKSLTLKSLSGSLVDLQILESRNVDVKSVSQDKNS
jgi:hypothetical protein